MRDREVVASIKAGDPAGLAEAYARYAASLYAYCASILREPADAADAVQDTFLIAASGLRGLRDPDRLRPWLYTVARNVCMGKLRRDKLTARYAPVLGAPAGPGDDSGFRSRRAGQVIDPSALADPAQVGDRAERAELQAFVHDAAAGLTVRDREILQLRLWHGLSPEESAAALGLSRGHASALFSRARAQLETSLGVLLVARSGRLDCEPLNSLLGDWDGQLTVLLRKRLSRHIEHCETCGQRRRRELVPAFLGLSPGAAIAGAAAAQAALHGAQLPAGLQSRVLAAASHAAGGHTAAAVSAGAGAQQAGAQQAGAQQAGIGQAGIGQAGGAGTTIPGAALPGVAHFARAIGVVGKWRPRTARGQLTTLGAGAAAAVTAAVLAIALHGGGHGHLAGGGGASPSAAATGPGAAAPGTGTGPGGASHPGNGRSGSQGSGPGASGPGSAGSPTGTRAGSGGASLTGQRGGSLAGSGTLGNPATGGGPSAGASPPPAGSAPSSAPPSSGGQSPSSPPSSPPPAPPSSTPPPPVTGTVSVSTSAVLLAAPLLNTTITLTASGGPVTWSIAQRPGLLGGVSVFPTSGKLAAGQSAHVSVSARNLAGLLSTLTVSPGGSTVTVVVSIGI